MDEKCFAEVSECKCAVLTVYWCPSHGNCSFFKTKEQVEIEKQKSFKRIASLPLEKQQYISDCHYGGKMPWHVKG